MPSEQEPAQVDAPKVPEVKYVLSGQPTGWWAAAKDVREFDVEKVQSCKEDIDTLLVFAGLFSAVLSAFLVAVYPNLQQQPSDRIVYAIERVAAQTAGYRVNLTDGTLIAANIPPSFPPSFQVSDNDIRVNVLWFASLIISLVTASFGMLVKQWLREFLATEDPSALRRLRLRHFREPQMKAWMVYEIAGLLPILLHISLGLFFAGLCYFTSSVHSSVGHTTIPLVIGWALCFFAATTLPIFFPRCPYKVAFLKVLIVRLHRLVRRFAKWLYPQRDEQDAGQSFTTYVRRATTVLIGAKCHKYLKSLVRAVVTAAQDIPDEAILVQHPKFDLDILSSVDAIQGNDEMLATIIPEALLYIPRGSSDVVHFVIQLLEHRVSTLESSRRVVEYWPFHDMAPLDPLRPQVRDHILSILFDHIKDLDIRGRCYPYYCFEADSHCTGGVCRDHIAVFRALFLVTSIPRELVQPGAIIFLKKCFRTAHFRPGFWRWLCHGPVTTGTDGRASPELDRAFIIISAINDLTNSGQLQLSLKQRVTYSTQIPHPYFPDLADKHIDLTAFPWDTWRSSTDFNLNFSCMVFWLDASSEGLSSLHSQPSADPPPLVASVVGFSLRQFHGRWTGPLFSEAFIMGIERKLLYNSFRRMAHIAVKRKDTALVFTNALIDEFQRPPHSAYLEPLIGGNPLLDMFRSSAINNRDQPRQDPVVIRAIFHLVTSKVAEYQEQERDMTLQLRIFQVLAFFLITIDVPPDLRKECRGMFSSLATSLFESHSQVLISPDMRGELQMAAQGCLDIMDHENHGFRKLDGPRGSEQGNIFPDTLLDVLQRLSSGQFHRLLPCIIGKMKLDTHVGHSTLTSATETQPDIEPDPTSAAVTDSPSTSDQAFDASDLVQSTSRGEPQPAYAMQDAEKTKAAQEEEEEENDARSSDTTER